MAMQRPPKPKGQFKTESTATSDTVLVGIPAYNEEAGIGSVVLAAKEFADEVIVIDGGSADKTVDIATQAGVTVIEHPENSEKGRAVQTLLQEVESRDFSVLVLLDGEGQHVPADIPDVTEPVLEGDCDIAIGSPYLAGEQTETPFHRRFGRIDHRSTLVQAVPPREKHLGDSVGYRRILR